MKRLEDLVQISPWDLNFRPIGLKSCFALKLNLRVLLFNQKSNFPALFEATDQIHFEETSASQVFLVKILGLCLIICGFWNHYTRFCY